MSSIYETYYKLALQQQPVGQTPPSGLLTKYDPKTKTLAERDTNRVGQVVEQRNVRPALRPKDVPFGVGKQASAVEKYFGICRTF